MLPFKSVPLYWWLLGCTCISLVFTQAADPLYETVFLVGPDPQPVIVDTTESPLGSMMNGSSASVGRIYQPLASRSESNGNRKRGVRLRRESFAKGATATNSLAHERTSKSSDKSLLHRRLRYDNVSNSQGVTRTLQGGCNITKTILGFNFSDNLAVNGNVYAPPDPHGAVGMSRLVAVGNLWMEVRQKNGTLLLRQGFRSFFSELSAAAETGTSFSDPKVIYDEHEGRFVMVLLQFGSTPVRSRIWLAVSKSETPDAVSDWYKVYINSLVRIDRIPTSADYPGLEVDEEAVYVTNNMFEINGDLYRGVRLWVIRKGLRGGLYSGAKPFWRVYNPYASVGTPKTTMPTQVHGSKGVDGSVGTFLTSVILDFDGSVQLQIYTLFNPLSVFPSYIFQTIRLGVISQEFAIPDAPQLGTTAKLDSGDYRALDAVWRNNKLWVVFMFVPTSGVNQGQATAHWVRLATSGGSVTLEAQGDLGGEDIAAGTHTFYPSVAVNSRGVVAYGYSASSPTTYAGAYVSVGTSETSYTVKSGLDPYIRTFGGSRYRWGDYSGIAVDPTDDSFWIFNEYSDTRDSSTSSREDGRWGTAIARLACDSPQLTAPSPAQIPGPQVKPPTTRIEPPVCGLLGLSLLCPLSFCGLFGRLLGLCSS